VSATSAARATSRARPAPPQPRPHPIVLVAGNPNAGKSTLFNALTGATTKVSNYPGVTVARTSATMTVPGAGVFELVDLPGTYSLSARSRDEQVAVDAILGRLSSAPDAVIVVADATALERNLYFANEVIETGIPVVVALSMMDDAAEQGIRVSVETLSAAIGAEVVPVVARRGKGLRELAAAVARATARGAASAPPSRLAAETEADVAQLVSAVDGRAVGLSEAAKRTWAIWLLLSLDDAARDDLSGIDPGVRTEAARIRMRALQAGRDLDQEIIGGRYVHVDAAVARAVTITPPGGLSWTEHIDRVLTHRVWGFAVFAAVMLVLFQALFTWSEPAIGLIESQVTRIQDLVAAVMPAGPFRDLLVDGVIAGVGNVTVFVPQIAMLFFFIGILEDLGYLARVAFVIDRLMGRVGLHGKSFVPMLSGFSCAVPAVLATRTLENRTDRMLTMMVLPLISCSARLPIYVLVIATVFSPSARAFGIVSAGAVALFAMYFLSVTAALTAAAVLRRTIFRGPRPTLMLELPPYRRPVLRVLLRSTWQQVRSFLVNAGTVILALTIVLWALLSYPKDDAAAARVAAERSRIEASSAGDARNQALDTLAGQERGQQLRHSVAGRVGHLIEPLIAPLGFDWRIGVGILGAFAAREVFVSTMGIVFDINDADEQNQPLREALRSATRPDGSALMTPLTGLSLMVFFVLACQCMSTLAVVRRESGSWKWPLFMFGYQTVFAYTAALVVFQAGRALGFA
jgi:ferrous iron transport protein B